MTAAADSPPAAQPDGIPWERGRPARILSTCRRFRPRLRTRA